MSASDWYNNSLVDLNNKSEFNDTLAIVAMVITSLLLVHSVYLHGGKPKTVRVFADVCSLCGLATGVACYISKLFTVLIDVLKKCINRYLTF